MVSVISARLTWVKLLPVNVQTWLPVSVIQQNGSGSCVPKDFETMMQLTYLTFTSPRKDNEAFESYKNRLKAELQNADANPMTAFSDTITSVLYGHHPTC